MNMRAFLVGACLALALGSTAYAGRSCEAEHPPKAITVERGLAMAERTYKALEASGERVVILARAGQDLRRHDDRYRRPRRRTG